MDVEEIFAKHREIVERKFREYNGLVNKETVAYIVAQEMGIVVEEESTPELKIAQLVPGMRRVSLTGKVLAANPMEEYTRKDGMLARSQRLILRDESGRAEIMRWESPGEELKPGDLVKIDGGYVKSLENNLQLNVTGKGSVEVLGFEALGLADVMEGAEGLTVKASILRVHTDQLFQSKRGGVFRASSLTLIQGSMKARVIFWEEEADKTIGLNPFHEVELTSLSASSNEFDLLELKASTSTRITTLEEIPSIQIPIHSPCEIVHPELDVDIRGEINSIVREPEWVAVTMTDEKAEMRMVVIHQDLVPSLRDVTVGEQISAKGVDIVHAPSGELEAKSTIWTKFSLH